VFDGLSDCHLGETTDRAGQHVVHVLDAARAQARQRQARTLQASPNMK
jgi:hypothetical protein